MIKKIHRCSRVVSHSPSLVTVSSSGFCTATTAAAARAHKHSMEAKQTTANRNTHDLGLELGLALLGLVQAVVDAVEVGHWLCVAEKGEIEG